MHSNIFDRISFWALFLVVTLLPIFFLPFTNIPVEISKGLILVLGLTVSVIFWGFARFFDGKITLPRSAMLLGGAGIVFSFFLSALFLKASQISFFGTMFDVGTFWFIFAGFVLMLMSAITFKELQKARVVLFGVMLSSLLVLVFQGLHLFLPKALALGVLVGKTDNIIGTWNAFGIFAGFSALVALLVVEFFQTTKMEKWILRALVVFSMLLVATVNFPLVWILLGISALIIFIYKISVHFGRGRTGEHKLNFPAFSFIVIFVSLLFFMSGNFIGGLIPNRLGISNTEVSPSFASTMSVTGGVLKHNPILGIGPNQFEEAWANYKPLAINTTQFWDVSFSFGSGLLPTFAVTTGYLGILAWLIFFFLFIKKGIKSIFSSVKDGLNWEVMTFFVLALYLFIACFFYASGAVLFLLALAFAGVFAGLSSVEHHKGEVSISFLNDHRKSFFSILFILVLIIVSVATAFKYGERFVSIPYFRQALSASTIPDAEASISKALTLYTNDLYLRTYSQIYLVKLNSLVQKGASITDADKALIQPTLDQAVSGAQSATMFNPKNYLNFKLLGSVFQAAGTLGAKDVYGKAIDAYKTALSLNPNNPGLMLDIANVSAVSGNTKDAKDYANKALSVKPNYIDAFIFLSQIAKSEGDTAGATSYAEKALSFDPSNKDLIKYVNNLKNPTPATSPTTTSTKPATKTPPATPKKK